MAQLESELEIAAQKWNNKPVAQFESELEITAQKKADDLPLATMTSTSSKNKNLLSSGNDTNRNTQCAYREANDAQLGVILITRQKDAGKVRGLIYVLRGKDRKKIA